MIYCVRCDRGLQNILDDSKGFQPYDGLAFYTRGHYGSTYFDPMDERYLEVVVCDDCVSSLEKVGQVRRS